MLFQSLRESEVWRTIRLYTPELNFITIHYAYFIFTSLITAVIFWGSASPRNVDFTDALFLTSSAMTEAGLNTVNLSQLNTFQQFLLFLLILMGSAIFVSAFVVLVRKNAFEKKFPEELQRRKRVKQARGGPNRARSTPLKMMSRNKPLEDVEKSELQDKVENEGEADLSKYSSLPSVPEDIAATSPKRSALRIPGDLAISTGSGMHIGGASDSIEMNNPNALQSPLSPIARSPGVQFEEEAAPPEPGVARTNTMRYRGTQVTPQAPLQRMMTFKGVGSTPYATLRRPEMSRRTSTQATVATHSTQATEDSRIRGQPTDPWFESKAGYIARNSQFHNLDRGDRQRLGGVEYKAILFLSFLVPIYFFIWQFLGALSLGAWVAHNRASTAYENGINPWWVGAFNAVSAFNNSGMSLLDANMIAFHDSVFMLLSMGLFILAGNTAYPIFLRIAIWVIHMLLPDDGPDGDRATLLFLLQHPRRCYTNLFPSIHTWWLGLTLIVLNGVDWAAFEVLNIGNHKITDRPAGIEVVDGLFQAIAVRAGGFYVVPIPHIRISLQVLYVVMMYISAYPVSITMRNSNVYEERSLGIFADESLEPDEKPQEQPSKAPFGGIKRTLTGFVQPQPKHGKTEERAYFVRQQLRAQLAHDAWWIVLAVFLIMIIEGTQFERDPAAYSVFNVIFEVVSGYACVGISVGFPGVDYSFSGSWRRLSKLVMIAVMIRGRHRGLPVAIDLAVQLPDERLGDAEEEDGQRRSNLARGNTFELKGNSPAV